MQPCSREMQGMNSMLSPSQISLQDLQSNPQQIQNPQIQVHNSHFDASSHNDFLEQMFSTISSNSWPPELNPPTNNPKMLSEETAAAASSPGSLQFPYDDQSALLASKLRQHQISGGDSAAAAAAKILLQQQMMMQIPLNMNGDGAFKSPSQGGEGSSMQALYNGFSGSLHGSGQATNPTQHFQHPQGGGMQGQSFSGAPSPTASTMNQSQASGSTSGAPQQPRPRVRARRGQATDPHSIAERLRRERIAERMKALQELVPNANKTDKASMLDEIIDYVKFLQLQVKVLSMSRLGGAAAVAPLVADMASDQGQGGGGGASCGDGSQPNGGGGSLTGRFSNGNGNDSLTVTEQQVAKLMEEDMGQAMQYLQGKGLCLMPISLATAISTVTSRNHRHILQSNGGEGPSSPSMSVLTVQSGGAAAAAANGGGEASAAKDAASVTKQ